MPFNQLYITNKSECFTFKSGCTVWVVKLIKAYSVNLEKLLKSFITEILENNCVATYINMCSLVMSLCSSELLITTDWLYYSNALYNTIL